MVNTSKHWQFEQVVSSIFFVVNFICVRLFAVGNYYAIDCLHLTSSWRHVQVRIWVSLGCETSLTFSTCKVALHWKCTSVNAFIPQWNFKRMQSILKWYSNKSNILIISLEYKLFWSWNSRKKSHLALSNNQKILSPNFKYRLIFLICNWLVNKQEHCVT
jgi:hypothetical protein